MRFRFCDEVYGDCGFIVGIIVEASMEVLVWSWVF